VDDVGPAVCRLAETLGVAAPDPFPGWDRWLAGWRARRPALARPVFVPVWRRPWMSLAADTFGSSLLDLLGWDNVFAGAASRYPEVTLEDAAALGPEVVLLPSEPYEFKKRHVAEVTGAIPGARVLLVDGHDLFWWGIRTPGAVERLAAALV
jgi:ABC-type Fe3+-hydroxamate transport system substrate-binding protein